MPKKGKKTKEKKVPERDGKKVPRTTSAAPDRFKDHHHAYLNAIGIKSSDCCVFASTDDTDKRQERFLIERDLHSFDSRETWSLDYTLTTWLYEHLMAYKEYAGDVVDLTYKKFDVMRTHITKKGHVKTKKVTLTQEEAIDLACNYLRKSLRSQWDDLGRTEYTRAALRIVTEMLPDLWW